MSISPPRWQLDELSAGAQTAVKVFRFERMNEQPGMYSSFYEEALAAVQDLLELTDDLLDLEGTSVEVVRDYYEAFRYIGAPPISDDDLITLSNVASRDFTTASGSRTVVETVLQIADRNRFPWLLDGGEPTEDEKRIAAIATAAMIANSRVQAFRRNEAKRVQEDLVKDALRASGFKEVAAKRIATSRDFPDPGTFCGESSVGGSKADIVVGLWDDRILCIECKSSNSAINSYKRVVHEAGGKATKWITAFGKQGIVPAAVIAGVYRADNLVVAQDHGLTIWWSHSVEEMVAWIETTRS